MKKKILTIILPTFNSAKYLHFFLDSLQRQSFKNFQVYVADNKSSDQTLKIINKYFNFCTKIISRSDKSFENGVNKCLKKINSKYFCIFGSDDALGDKHYLKNLIATLNKNNCSVVFPQFGVIENLIKRKVLQTKDFNHINYKTILPGVGWIAKTEVLNNHYFNENIEVASDYDFLIRLFKKNYKFIRAANAIYYFRLGTGTSYKKVYKGFVEQKNISIQNKGPFFKIHTLFLVSYIKFFLKDKFLKIFFLKSKM
jgi:glycosyltransferase involved in cell wall biosynthesis